MASKVGDAYVDISTRDNQLVKGLSDAESKTSKSMNAISAKMANVGKVMTIAGAAITAAFGLTVKAAINFNKEIANIATLIPGSTKRVDELKSAIRNMAVAVGKDTADLAQGAYQVISAWGDTADTVGILGIAAKAATAGVAMTTEAINLLSAVTKGYGDTSKEAVQKASDLAFQTVTLGQTTFPELAASIGKVIPLTSELGVSQEELFAVMATGTGVTGKAAEVSTQLRGIMQSLMSPTADMTDLLAEKEYVSGKAMLADLGLAGALDVIKKAAEASNTPLQKYISSIEGQTLALALTGTQADTYIEKLASMRDSTGLTDIAFKEQTEGVNAAGFAFQQAKIQIGVLAQEIGDKLLPMLVPLIQKFTEIVGKIRDWADAHKPLVERIVKVTATLGLLAAVGGPILMAAAAFMKVKTIINSVTFALKLLNIRIGATSTLTTGTLIPSLSKVAVGFGIPLAPIAILAVAVGGLYAVWKTNLFGMRDITEEVFASIKGNFVDLVDTLGGGGGGAGAFFDDLTESVNNSNTSFTNMASALDIVNTKMKESEGTREELLKVNQKFADAMQPIYDRLFEMSHTEEEVAVKALKAKRDALIKTVETSEESAERQAEAISKIEELYNLEIGLIIGKLEEERNKLIEIAKQSEMSANEQIATIRKINKEHDTRIDKLNEVAEATEASAERQLKAMEIIKDAAGVVTTVILPGGGIISTEAITAANVGAGYYGEAPSYQHGIDYVPRTELAMVHKGEEINPPGQRSYDQRKSYTSTASINIQPGGIQIITPKFGENDAAEMLRKIKRRAAMEGLKFATA